MHNSNISFPYSTFQGFIDHVSTKGPNILYPDSSYYFVQMGATCGLGHRLARNAKIYHLARLLGYRVGVIWQPFKELFRDSEYLLAQKKDPNNKYIFTNEPGLIEVVHPSRSSAGLINKYLSLLRTFINSGNALPRQNNINLVGFQDVQCSNYMDYDLSQFTNRETLKYRLFTEASMASSVHFQILLLSHLRTKWLNKIDKFLRKYNDLNIIALHMRTGNGEGGDFSHKEREIDTEAILRGFLTHLDSQDIPVDSVIFVASDDPCVFDFLQLNSKLKVIRFCQSLPKKGIITYDWTSGETPPDRNESNRINAFFESYADMCILGYANDLYISAWTSFVIGSCIFHKLNGKNGKLKLFDPGDCNWKCC